MQRDGMRLGASMDLDDGLEIVTSLLTLVAIAMVALEKARPDDDGARKARLRAFLSTSILASPRRIQRTAAKIVADALRSTTGLSGLIGLVGAPLMTLFRKWGAAQSLIVIALYGVNLAFAAISGSVWLSLILPGLALGMLLIAATYPSVYMMLNSAKFDEAVRRGDVLGDRRGQWIVIRETSGRPGAVLRLLSRIHPKVRRHEDAVAFRDRFSMLELWPLGVGLLCLLPAPLAIIDGFAFSGLIWQVGSLLVGTIFLFGPVLLILALQLPVFQTYFSRQTVRQTAWSGSHNMRVVGPSAIIAIGVTLSAIFLHPPLQTGGGGWLALVMLFADLLLALLTGERLRAVVRTRASAASSLAALVWVIFLAVMIAGLKLFLGLLLSGEPLSLWESYRIAWGLELTGPDTGRQIALFVAAQTVTLAGLAYAALLLVMLSLSAFAGLLRSIFGLALSTVSPLEILASYLTALAAIAVLIRSLAKLFVGSG